MVFRGKTISPEDPVALFAAPKTLAHLIALGNSMQEALKFGITVLRIHQFSKLCPSESGRF
jgi:hypothetical protein